MYIVYFQFLMATDWTYQLHGYNQQPSKGGLNCYFLKGKRNLINSFLNVVLFDCRLINAVLFVGR